jgi:hypothetical protein
MSKTDRPAPAWAEPFIASLSRHGNARQAAREAGTNHHSPHHRRRTNQAFAEQWDQALACVRAAREAARQPQSPVTGRPARNWPDRFFAQLAATSNIAASAASANVTVDAVYKRKRSDPRFAARWLAALHEGYDLLEMELLGYLRDRQPGWKMEVSGALRVLAAHRATVERRRLMTDEEDEQAVLESIDAFLEGMRERRLANEAILLEAKGEHVAR